MSTLGPTYNEYTGSLLTMSTLGPAYKTNTLGPCLQ